ncbi:MAG: hypothetical protein HY288_14750 [Planctomycetia bacterium]|nr:hypothetical protein [Planctomycetia bacterium]
MSEIPQTRQPWLRFSLRTLLVVVTVFGGSLGWNLRQVRERETWRQEIPIRGGDFGNAVNLPPKPGPVPFFWSLLGAKPLDMNAIRLPTEKFSSDEIKRIRGLFPEVNVGTSTNSMGPVTEHKPNQGVTEKIFGILDVAVKIPGAVLAVLRQDKLLLLTTAVIALVTGRVLIRRHRKPRQ